MGRGTTVAAHGAQGVLEHDAAAHDLLAHRRQHRYRKHAQQGEIAWTRAGRIHELGVLVHNIWEQRQDQRERHAQHELKAHSQQRQTGDGSQTELERGKRFRTRNKGASRNVAPPGPHRHDSHRLGEDDYGGKAIYQRCRLRPGQHARLGRELYEHHANCGKDDLDHHVGRHHAR